MPGDEKRVVAGTHATTPYAMLTLHVTLYEEHIYCRRARELAQRSALYAVHICGAPPCRAAQRAHVIDRASFDMPRERAVRHAAL